MQQSGNGSSYPGAFVTEDLTRWVDRKTLLRLVWHVVQAVPETDLHSLPGVIGQYRVPPRTLLTLLTFCYAAGIYASRAVEEDLSRDDTIRYLCAWGFPSRQLLRDFRQRNRTVIVDCLFKVSTYVWGRKQRLHAGTSGLPPAIEFEIPQVTDRTTEARLWVDVQERLNLAELADDSPFNN